MDLFKPLCLISILCLLVVDSVLAAQKQSEKRKHKKFFKNNKKVIVKNNDSQPPQVRLEHGPTIIGNVNKTIDEKKMYCSFRGIPFAEPPVGNLRFRPPVPLSGDFSQKTVYASKDGPPCVQSQMLPSAVIGSEDCLYINVYTPQCPGQNVSLLPVMVWIFGGAFVVGDGTYNSFGPDYFLDEGGVIIVTFNYRVGIFGFLSTEDDASPGNYGLKDQVLALKWVKANIQAFGGNPEQVTIFGESAGSVSVSYLSQTPLTKGLFRGAILESGTTLNLWGLTRHPKTIAVATANFLKADTTTSQALVEALRKADYKQLQTAEQVAYYGQLLLCNPLNGLPFGPTMEPLNSGAVVVNKSHQQLTDGLFHHVPYMIGLNSLESIPFVDVLNLIRWYLIKYDLGPTALVPASMNIDDLLIKEIVNSEIKSHYFGLTPVALSEEKLLRFTSDDEFNRPIIEAARLYSQESPVYMYKFAYEGSLGGSGNTSQKGVGHAEELPYIWRISGSKAWATQSDILMRRRMIKLWINFAKTGNPTPESDGLLQNVKWPQVSEAGKGNIAYLDINKNLTTNTNPYWTQYTFWSKLFNKYGNPPYSTY